MSVEPGRGIFPLAVETAKKKGHFRRAALPLVGETAHVVPPISMHGFQSIRLRDAATVAEMIDNATASWP